MICYWKEPEKTKETIDRNHWLNTGDIASMDKDGFITFRGRQKEIIKYYDSSYYPFEIESNIEAHPNVLESCVFGVPISDYETIICAWILLKDKSIQTSHEELKEFCCSRLDAHKVPKHMKFVDEFPRNALGKFVRQEMATQFKQELKY